MVSLQDRPVAEAVTDSGVYEDANPAQIKKKLIKDLLVVSFGMFMQNLFAANSTLDPWNHSNNHLTLTSLLILQLSGIAFVLFIPKLVIRITGYKWTIVATIVSQCVYYALFMYPTMPSAITIGIVFGIFYSTQCVSINAYVNAIANNYSSHFGVAGDDAISMFFGILVMVEQQYIVVSYAISYTALKTTTSNADVHFYSGRNISCGLYYCPEFHNGERTSKLNPVDMQLMLARIYTTLLGAIFVALFLGSRRISSVGYYHTKSQSFFAYILSALRPVIHYEYVLLAPMTLYLGLQQSFILLDFSLAYIDCLHHKYFYQLAIIPYGVTSSLCSHLSGSLIRFVPRTVLIACGFFSHLATAIGILSWVPTTGNVVLLFSFAALWGIGEGILNPQILALYGSRWHQYENSTFAIYSVWILFGRALSMTCAQQHCCTYTKVAALMCSMILGMICYFILEVIQRRKAKFIL